MNKTADTTCQFIISTELNKQDKENFILRSGVDSALYISEIWLLLYVSVFYLSLQFLVNFLPNQLHQIRRRIDVEYANVSLLYNLQT